MSLGGSEEEKQPTNLQRTFCCLRGYLPDDLWPRRRSKRPAETYCLLQKKHVKEIAFRETLAVEEVVRGDQEVPGERSEPGQAMHPVDCVADRDDLRKAFHLHENGLERKGRGRLGLGRLSAVGCQRGRSAVACARLCKHPLKSDYIAVCDPIRLDCEGKHTIPASASGPR